MNVYGSTCPMCCGDLDDAAYLRTGNAVCLSCGCNTEAPASTPSTARQPEAIALTLNAFAMRDPATAQEPISLSHLIQNQTAGAFIAHTELTIH